MKISAWWLLLALLVGLSAAYIYFKVFYVPIETFSVNGRRKNDVVVLSLPNDPDSRIFGPKYWKAYHQLTERIQCSICRSDAVPFMNFFHDYVNRKTRKPIFDKENFNKHIDMISQLEKA